MRSFETLAFAALAAIWIPACGGDDAAAGAAASGGSGGAVLTGGTGGTAASGGAGGASGAAGSAPECPGPGYGEPQTPRRVGLVTATVVEVGGAPIVDQLVLVCGLASCFNGTTGGDGAVGVRANENMLKPAFKFGDGLTHALLARPLPAGAEDYALGTVTTAPLPPYAAGQPLVAGATVSSGGVTLGLAADADVDLDKLTYAQADRRGFRAVSIPVEHVPGALEATPPLALVWGLAPVETHLCPPAKLTVPNDAGWAPGASVEVLVHGAAIEEAWAPYGGWGKVSDAVVSADGARVETVEGGGLPLLSAIGLRLAP
ncbi:MAG: hypothetical protein IT376_09030 [Polyangiaceae bacterium]|nr:hypothetical protein [Polyangiaceae bacterium]